MRLLLTCTILLLLLAVQAKAGKTLDGIREKDRLRCGVNTALAGFSISDSKGEWTGIDVEYCRALAAAVLGDKNKVTFVPLGAQQRFTALQSGEVDILARNTTWSLSRDAGQGITFVGTLFYDGQGFLVPADLKINRVTDLDGATICVQSGTTTELNLADYFRKHGLEFTPVVFEGFEESIAAFFKGRCDAYTTDASALAVIRLANAPTPDKYELLRETISKEPLAPAVRQDDWEWFTIARWVLYGLLQAEELGIRQENVAEMRKNSNPAVQRFLGTSKGFGKSLGLPEDWAARMVSAVGNYGEIYNRTLGHDSTLKLDRSFNDGLNLLWTDGGLHYPPAFR